MDSQNNNQQNVIENVEYVSIRDEDTNRKVSVSNILSNL